MNVVDEVEWAYFEYTGSLDVAVLAGRVLREQLEFAAWLFNVPVETLLEHLEEQ